MSDWLIWLEDSYCLVDSQPAHAHEFCNVSDPKPWLAVLDSDADVRSTCMLTTVDIAIWIVRDVHQEDMFNISKLRLNLVG